MAESLNLIKNIQNNLNYMKNIQNNFMKNTQNNLNIIDNSTKNLTKVLNQDFNIDNSVSNVFNTMSQAIDVCNVNYINLQQTFNNGIETTKVEKANSSLATISETIGKIAGKAKNGIKNIMSLSDSMAQTASKVNFMNAGLDNTDNIQQKILNSSNQARMSYEQTSNAVAELGIGAKNAFSSSDEVVGFAELVSKQFQIAGASQEDAIGGISQLSQAMGDGVLSGGELNQIFAQTPNIIEKIADYMNEPIDKVLELGENGQITSDVLKNALFSASDEINDSFGSLPMTWGDIESRIKNQALGAFEPILMKVNEIANSEGVQKLVAGISNGLLLVGNTATQLFDTLVGIGSTIYENWSIIGPIIMGVAAAFLVLTAYTKGAALATTIFNTAQQVMGAVQAGLGVVMANPMLLFAVVAIAVIAIIYAVVGAINHLTGSTLSATGIIIGSLATAVTFIWNIIVGLVNAIWTYIAVYANAIIGVVEWVLNVFGGGFDSFGEACANLIGNIISWFLGLGQIVTKIIDAIFGTNWSDGLESMKNKMLSWGKNDNAITLKRFSTEKILERKSYEDAFNKGYNVGEDIDSKVSNFFEYDKNSITNSLLGSQSATNAADGTNINNSLTNIDTNTASSADSANRVADSVEIADEDIKYLRDIAEREIIDRTIFKSLSIDMGGISNTVNNMADLDGIAEYLGDVIGQAAVSSMEGV